MGTCLSLWGTWAYVWSWGFSLNRESPIVIPCSTRNHRVLYLFKKIFRIYPFYLFDCFQSQVKA